MAGSVKRMFLTCLTSSLPKTLSQYSALTGVKRCILSHRVTTDPKFCSSTEIGTTLVHDTWAHPDIHCFFSLCSKLASILHRYKQTSSTFNNLFLFCTQYYTTYIFTTSYLGLPNLHKASLFFRSLAALAAAPL